MNRFNGNCVTSTLLLGVALGLLSQHVYADAQAVQNPVTSKQQVELRAYFTPGDSPEKAIIEQIRSAKSTILVQAYSFTNPAIAAALVEARQRGVQVTVLLDRSQLKQKSSVGEFLAASNVQTYVDAQHAIAHNKIIIIDGAHVITGSYNFTRAAERVNAENLLVIDSVLLADQYTRNWQVHRMHSQPY